MGRAGIPDVRAARSRVRDRFLALPRLIIRPLDAADLEWAVAFLGEQLGGRMQARRGALVDVLDGDGLLAAFDGQAVGLITWVVARRSDTAAAGRHEAEIRAVAVSPPARGSGVGRAMLEAAEATLARSGVTVAWLVTTNDNLAALALYQKAGWRLDALRIGALEEARRSIKPSLPEIGQHGIPLRDELELAKQLHGPSNLVQTSPPLG